MTRDSIRVKNSSKPHLSIVGVAIILVVLLMVALLVPLYTNKNVAGEASRQIAVQVQNSKPVGELVLCPSYLSTKDDQNFLILPEGYSLSSLSWSKVKCQGTLIICEYAGGIRIVKDFSAEYSWCTDYPANNPSSCSCLPK